MANVDFINLHPTLQDALSEVSSPDSFINTNKGIQLIPNNENPYVQSTNVPGGIELEDWRVYVMRCKGSNPFTETNENLFVYSNDFENSAWDKNETTISSDEIIPTTNNSSHWITQDITKDSLAKEYTLSVTFKPNGYNRLYLRMNSDDGFWVSHFDALTESFTSSFGSGSSLTHVADSYTDEGDGWYRVSLTIMSGTDIDLQSAIGVVDDSGYFVFSGDGTSSLLIKQSQINEGGVSDYVETTSSPSYSRKIEGVDITDYFLVENIYSDDNGFNQFFWSLTNIPYDFGYSDVYLRIEQMNGEDFYTNLFRITKNDSERVSRLDYKDDRLDTMKSIGLIMWMRDTLKTQEISSYYETSTKNTVVTMVKSQRFEKWLTEVISKNLFLKITDLFENKYIYLDSYRCNLFEAIDVSENEGQENYSQNTLMITFNRNDVFEATRENIFPVPIVDNDPLIVLQDVVVNGIYAIYTFSYAYFSPTYLTFQYREVGSTSWTSTNYATNSPQSITFNGTGDWEFRIITIEAESNVIELNLGEDVVANNDSAQVTKGGSVSVNVLFNDVLVGDTVITGVSSPLNGTAIITDNDTKIEYTHNDSVTSSDSFTYTISNGISSDTATVSVVITETNTSSTPVFMSENGDERQEISCFLELTEKRYHNGESIYPNVNDFIFIDQSLINTFNGGDLWFGMQSGRAIRVNSNGRVTQVDLC